MEKLGSYTVIENNESVKDIIILSIKIETLQSTAGDIVSDVGLDFLDINKLNYLKENKYEFDRFIRVHRKEKKNTLK